MNPLKPVKTQPTICGPWFAHRLSALAAPLAAVLLALGLGGWPSVGAANTVDVSGVALNQRVTAHGSTLQLNGAGVRYKAVFKVYTAGL